MKATVEEVAALPCSVLSTHSHFDHVGSNFEFSSIAMFDHPDNRRAASKGFDKDYLSKWIDSDQFVVDIPNGFPDPYFIPPFPSAELFNDGDILERGAFRFLVLHTPGHSDDSICFFEQSRGWLFSGDLLYNGPIYIEKSGGLRKFRRSVERINQLSSLKRIFASHNAYELLPEKLTQLTRVLEELKAVDLEEEVRISGKLSLVPA